MSAGMHWRLRPEPERHQLPWPLELIRRAPGPTSGRARPPAPARAPSHCDSPAPDHVKAAATCLRRTSEPKFK